MMNAAMTHPPTLKGIHSFVLVVVAHSAFAFEVNDAFVLSPLVERFRPCSNKCDRWFESSPAIKKKPSQEVAMATNVMHLERECLGYG